MQKEIKFHLKISNGCYFAMSHLLKLKLLYRKTKENLCSIYLRPVLSYVSCTWVIIAGYENRLKIFERNVLRRIYGPVLNSDTQVW